MAHTIVIFGASGDLTSRKLIPALYELYRKKRLPEDTRVVGFARTPFSHNAWRQKLAETTAQFVGKTFDAARWQEFAPSIFYQPGDVGKAEDFPPLAESLPGGNVGQAGKTSDAAVRIIWPPPRNSTPRSSPNSARRGWPARTAAPAAS